jgi:hypothetical protein
MKRSLLRKLKRTALALALSGLTLNAAAAAAPVFSDDFGVTALLAEKWKLNGAGDWKVVDGCLQTTAAGKTCTATPFAPKPAGPIEVRCRVKVLEFGPKGGWAGVIMRGIHFTLQPHGFWHVYRIAGQKRSMGGIKTTESPPLGRWFEFRIVHKSDLYQWFVDGQPVAQFREPNELINSGESLVLATSGPRAAYDDVSIAPLGDSGPISPNFLRNASFEDVPDHVPLYWKPWAIAFLPPEVFWQRWRTETEGARHGRRVLKIVGHKGGNVGFFSHDNSVAEGKPCTFAIDLKADRPALKVKLVSWVFATGKQTASPVIEVGTNWSRHAFTFDTPAGNRLRVGVRAQDDGTLWADAAQLELGANATPFALSVFDNESATTPTAEFKPAASEPIAAEKAPPARGLVSIDRARRCLLVDGQPFFVSAPLIQLGPGATTESLDLEVNHHADNGFRTLAVVGKITEKWSAAMWQRLFEQCAARNLKVIAWPGGFNKLPREQFTGFVTRWREHPALIAWLPVDEPELYATPEETAQTIAHFKELDPRHPVYVNNTTMGIPSRFAGLPGDILSIDDYLTNREGRSVREIVRQVEIMEEAARPTRRPVWIFIVGNNLHNHYREPSAGEQVAQSYGCALAGASGLLYFLANPANRQHWLALRQTNRELTSLSPVLFSKEPAPRATCSSPAIRFVVRRTGAQVCLVAVNLENQAVAAKFQIGGLEQATGVVLFENRNVDVKSAVFTDDFAPHARHVYRFELKGKKP